MAGDYPFPDCANCRWREMPFKVASQVIIEAVEDGYVLELRDEYKAIRHRRFLPRIEIHDDIIKDWLDFGGYEPSKQ